jgi:hypothetical protein
MVLPSIFLSKTDGFSRQRHVAPLKLRHVATFFIIIIFYFEAFLKNKNKKIRGGWATPLDHIGVPGHPHFGQKGTSAKPNASFGGDRTTLKG